MNDRISPLQFHESTGVEDWRVLSEGACAFFRTGSLAASARFVQAIGELAGIDQHQPAIDIRGDGVTVRLLTVADDYWESAAATWTWPARSRRWPTGTA